MHTLLSLLLGCGSFFVINTEKLFHEQLLIAFVLLALVFFGGLGVAGLRHRPLYGGTVDCNALSASVALERELAGTAEIISFFSHCDSSRVEMLGFKNGLSGQKCCIPKPKQNTSFTCNHVALVPDLLHNPLAVTDDVHRGIYARCCPSIAGNTVPIGFAAMTVSAVIGIAVNILLNIGTAVVLPKLRKSVCGSGGSSDFKDNVRIGRKTLRFFGKCLQPSVIGTGKLLVSFAVNVISAIGVTAAASGSAWSKYCVFVSVMVNGSFVGNFSDFLCTFLVFEFGNLDSFASRSDKDDLDSFGELLEDVGIRIAAAIVIVYSPFICTHWVPGILTFFPWMAVFAIVAGTAFVLVKLSWQKVSELLELDETPMYGIVAYALLVFAFCLVINMTVLQVIRFPVNWSMMLYGETHYPFFAVRPGAGKSEQLADFYAALFHAPFYFLQMSSQSCSLLKSADSAFTHMNTVMMYV
jgi:hypothetical protein